MRHRTRIGLILAVLISSAFLADFCAAQPGSIDPSFNPGTGANGEVLCVCLQADGKMVIGGAFTEFNGSTAPYVTRLNSDGSIDQTFSNGGFNAAVRACALRPDGKIILAGDFTSYDGTVANRVVRLNDDGGMDGTFAVGSGANGSVRALALQSDGKVLMAGSFSTVNGETRNKVARLNSNGSVDSGFSTGSGPNGDVFTVAVQPSGKVIIGGQFTFFPSFPSFAGRITRLNTNGSYDSGFTIGSASADVHALDIEAVGSIYFGGAFQSYASQTRMRMALMNEAGDLVGGFNTSAGFNGVVYSIKIQNDGKLLVGGAFTEYNGTLRGAVARLMSTSAIDEGFNPGTGCNGHVNDMAIQPDDKIILVGAFTDYDGTSRNRVVRIIGCETPQPGIISGPDFTVCPGSVHSYSISPVAGASSYSWTLPDGWTGTSMGNSISATANGDGGTVMVSAVSDECGTGPARTLDVTDINAPEVEICLITVDSLSTHNIIYWEEPETELIDSFLVYREVTFNNYDLIGSVAYGGQSFFEDISPDADPNATFHRYKMATVDTCGTVSELSPYHRTIHLINNFGILQWSLYEIEPGINPVDFFRIYRDDNNTGTFQPITTTIPGGNFQYLDTQFPTLPNARYFVDVSWDRSCEFTRESVNTSRSNLDEKVIPGMDETLAQLIGVFPNPTKGEVVITLPVGINLLGCVVHDVAGKQMTVPSLRPNGNGIHVFDLEGLASGLYLIGLRTDVGLTHKRVIVH